MDVISVLNIQPNYMSKNEVLISEVYLKSISFKKGKKYLIRANSGKGKSSLLNFIFASNKNYFGKILFDNLDIKNYKSEKISSLRKKTISYIFQDFKLFTNLTVWENLIIKNDLTKFKSDNEIQSLLKKVGLYKKINTKVSKLSLGQRQRIAIIRSLCQPFDFLLMDEPFSNLDNDNIKILTELINLEIKKQNAGLILTTLNDEYLFKYDEILKL